MIIEASAYAQLLGKALCTENGMFRSRNPAKKTWSDATAWGLCLPCATVRPEGENYHNDKTAAVPTKWQIPHICMLIFQVQGLHDLAVLIWSRIT